MSLYDYLQILRRRWPVVLGSVLSALLLAVSVVWLTPASYSAKSRLLFGIQGETQEGQASRTFTYVAGMVQNYTRLATLPVVLDPVIANRQLNLSSTELAQRVTAMAQLDSLILEITVRDPDAARAADLANDIAKQLAMTVQDLQPVAGPSPFATSPPVSAAPLKPLAPPARITGQVVSFADTPQNPVWPRPLLTLLVGLGLGLVVGIGVAVTSAVVSTRISGRSAVAAVTTLPVVGTVPDRRARRFGLGSVLRANRQRTPLKEAREISANLLAVTAKQRSRTIAFASAYDNADTALTMAEVGGVLATSGNRVLLVDADLRTPQLGRAHDRGGTQGLSEVLAGRATWQQAMHRNPRTGAYVMTSGSGVFAPDALAGPRTAEVLSELGAEFDVILVNAAPVLRAADGLLLSALADAVVVVADEAGISREVLVDVLGSLDAVGARPVGVVLHG